MQSEVRGDKVTKIFHKLQPAGIGIVLQLRISEYSY